ncbi:MAG: hypothetical protein ACREML_13940, partial [Vulcanimicrobiaceae bacterium]
MAADLQAIAIGPQMIRIVNHPRAEPQHLAFQGTQQRQPIDRRGDVRFSPGQSHASSLTATIYGKSLRKCPRFAPFQRNYCVMEDILSENLRQMTLDDIDRRI